MVQMKIPNNINISMHLIIMIEGERNIKGKINRFLAEVHGFEKSVLSEEHLGQGLIKLGLDHLPALEERNEKSCDLIRQPGWALNPPPVVVTFLFLILEMDFQKYANSFSLYCGSVVSKEGKLNTFPENFW